MTAEETIKVWLEWTYQHKGEECWSDPSVNYNLDGNEIKTRCCYCCIHCKEKKTCKYACPMSNWTESRVLKECGYAYGY